MFPNSRFTFGLRRRLLLIGLIAIVPGLLMVLGTHVEQRNLARSAAETQAVTALRQVAGTHEQAIEQAISLASVLTDVPVVRTGSPEACSRYVAAVREREAQFFANIARVDPDDRFRCTAVAIDAASMSAVESRAIDQALAAREPRIWIGEYVMSPVTGGPILPVLANMIGEDGATLGVVGVTLDLASLGAALAASEPPEGTQLTLVDRNGTVLNRFPPDPAALGQPAPVAAALVRAAGERREGILQLPADPDRLYAFYRLPGQLGPGPLLYAAMPMADVYATVDSQLMRNLLALLLALSVMLGGSLIAGYWLVVRPIDRLRAVSLRLASGDLAARAALGPGRDEVAALGVAFDRMAQSLQTREAALERLNRVYAVLSSINGLIIRAERQEDLLNDACRIAVEQGGYRLAWIGLLAPSGERLNSVAAWDGDEQARRILVPAADAAPAALPELKAAIARGGTLVHPPPGQPPRWQPQTRELGEPAYTACALLPLKLPERTAGWFALYSGDRDAFDPAEMRLLEETAADISHALTHIAQAERLAYVSSNDPLTGLANADRFRDLLDLGLQLTGSTGGPLAVLTVGVHGLRDINSVHGLHAGDAVLRESAERLRVRLPTDSIIGRLHSGVFGLAVPKRARSGAGLESFLEALLADFKPPVRLSEGDLYVGIRIGVSLAPADGRTAALLIQRAEIALGTLKGEVERFQFYRPQLQQRAERRLRLERALRAALERSDELYLLYQPVVAVPSRRLVGAEALLRWRHPQLGELGPDDFIPMAERAGLMVPLGGHVLALACRQARSWADAGVRGIKLAVNVSASQLEHEGFLALVDETIHRFQVDPSELRLGLEVTESELMADPPRAITILTALKARGFTLSMDDFGTGYSSLAYLRRFPLDALKIDIAFIRDLGRDPISDSIVQAVIALARALGLATVAEGVETPLQFEQLARYGCDSVQGHLFARAMPAAGIPDLQAQPLDIATDSGG